MLLGAAQLFVATTEWLSVNTQLFVEGDLILQTVSGE